MPRHEDQAETEAQLLAALDRAVARRVESEDVTLDERYQQLEAKQEAERSDWSALVATLPDTCTVSTLDDDLRPVEVNARTALTSILDTRHRQQRRMLRQELLLAKIRPSAEQEALERRSHPSVTGRRTKSLQRFGYWRIPDLNPDAVTDPPDPSFVGNEAHAYLERYYGDEFRQGDQDALFRFAKEDSWCLRSAWVVEQLETWRDQGPLGRKQMKRFVTAFFSNQTTTGLPELHGTIVSDQRSSSACSITSTTTRSWPTQWLSLRKTAAPPVKTCARSSASTGSTSRSPSRRADRRRSCWRALPQWRRA